MHRYLGRVARAAGDKARRLGLFEELLCLFRAEVGPDGTPQLLVLLLQGGHALLERLQEELLAHPRPFRVLPIALPVKKMKNSAKTNVDACSLPHDRKYDDRQFWDERVNPWQGQGRALLLSSCSSCEGLPLPPPPPPQSLQIPTACVLFWSPLADRAARLPILLLLRPAY